MILVDSLSHTGWSFEVRNIRHLSVRLERWSDVIDCGFVLLPQDVVYKLLKGIQQGRTWTASYGLTARDRWMSSSPSHACATWSPAAPGADASAASAVPAACLSMPELWIALGSRLQ